MEAIIINECNKIRHSTNEMIIVLSLDDNNKIIKVDTVASGNLYECPIRMGEIYHAVLRNKCTNFIICHNHIIGNSTPSEDDNELTRTAKKRLQFIQSKSC